jgi:hypothetical protein
MSRVLGWSEAEQAAQVAAYRHIVKAEQAAGNLPEAAFDAAIGA